MATLRLAFLGLASLSLTLLLRVPVVQADNQPFVANLAYKSPFEDHPQFDLDTRSIHKTLVKRQAGQTTDASPFKDEHYETFYGADFSKSPTIWSGGINFTHGIASGDPWDTSIILWTRAVPSGEAYDSVPVCVSWSLASSPDTLDSAPIAKGQAFTSYDVDWTVKVEATGLSPDTKYVYQFRDCAKPDTKSPVGNTRTVASPDSAPELVNGGKPMTFAVFSCSNFPQGYFNAYSVAANNLSVDIFVHLGDYLYEGSGGGAPIGRAVLGRELATIYDYRQRIAQYRTDVGLLAAHAKGPWVTVWDDHEVADNTWKAGTANSNDTSKGCTFSPSGACFSDRKFAAVRAYHEWMPIRQVSSDDKLRIWRNFRIGKLLDLTMLDTRQYDRDVTDLYYNRDYIQSIVDIPNRSVMGAAQETWFLSTLTDSVSRGAIWRIVGNQIIFDQLNRVDRDGYNMDSWDGYRANRLRVLDHIKDNGIDNVVFLAGDSHVNWVFELTYPNDTNYDPSTGTGAYGVEFAGTAVSSGSSMGSNIQPDAADAIARTLVGNNTDLHWCEGSYRGFFTLSIAPDTLNATFYAMRNISNANVDSFASATFTVEAGANKLKRPVAGGSVQAGVLKASSQST